MHPKCVERGVGGWVGGPDGMESGPNEGNKWLREKWSLSLGAGRVGGDAKLLPIGIGEASRALSLSVPLSPLQ